LATVARVLVVGLPRSGTTWVASMLARTEDAVLVHEPDNHFTVPFAVRAKRPLRGGFYTSLAPGDRAPAYEELWREAFGERGSRYTHAEHLRRSVSRRLFEHAGEDSARHAFTRSQYIPPTLQAAERLAVPDRPPASASAIVVKSVYAALAAEWIATRVGAQVVVVLRDLRNLLSSWIALGWADADEYAACDPPLLESLARRHGAPPPPGGGSRLARLAWLLALLDLTLETAARAHPEWHVVRHEDLAAHPVDRFHELATRLELRWGAGADAALAAADRPGSGYALERLASTLPDVWRTRLTAEQAAVIAAVLGAFPG
jgi:hypothetical protein